MQNPVRLLLRAAIALALLLPACPSLEAAYSSSSVQVTPDSVEGQNIQLAADFLRAMGDEQKALNIEKWLKDGKIYWDPTLKENGDTSALGDVTISKQVVRNDTNAATRSKPFDKDKDFDSIVQLARTLFHEKVHVHQSNVSIIWSNLPGKTPHEFEAWSLTLAAMDRWIKKLYYDYTHIPRANTAARLKALKQLLSILGQKSSYLHDFLDQNCFGYSDKVDEYKKLQETIQNWERMCRDLIAQLETLQATPAPAAGNTNTEVGSARSQDDYLKTTGEIETALAQSQPVRILRDDELYFEVLSPNGSAAQVQAQGLDLIVHNASGSAISAVLPAGIPIGPAAPPGTTWITSQASAVESPADADRKVHIQVTPAGAGGQTPSIFWTLAPPAPAASATSIVGIVLPNDTHPGDHVSGTVMEDTSFYQHLPAYRVIPLQVAATALASLRLNFGDGFQPADRPFTITVPPSASQIPVTAVGAGQTDAVLRSSLPVGPAAKPPAQAPAGTYQMPAICMPGTAQVIRGQFSGNSSSMRIEVGGKPAKIIAATPRAVYYLVPETLAVGETTTDIRDIRTRVVFRNVVLTLTMNADKTQLVRGESTRYQAVIGGLGSIPESAWQAAPAPEAGLMENIDLAKIQALVPNFRAPNATRPGTILFLIENASPAQVMLDRARNEAISITLDRTAVRAGSYSYEGTIRSRQSGGFQINGLVVPFLTPVQGTVEQSSE
jgi:hypothetical protein